LNLLGPLPRQDPMRRPGIDPLLSRRRKQGLRVLFVVWRFVDQDTSITSKHVYYCVQAAAASTARLADEGFIASCLSFIPDGSEFLVLEATRRAYGERPWVHWEAGESHAELREALADSRGTLVVVGPYPPWLEDTDDVFSAIVPDVNGIVRIGIFIDSPKQRSAAGQLIARSPAVPTEAAICSRRLIAAFVASRRSRVGFTSAFGT
jgi:hypothetical protein